jgi:hypothetical protein
MKTIDNSIYHWLLAQASITAFVGRDIYHGAKPDLLGTDYIVYRMESPSNEPYAFGVDSAQPGFRFDVYSKSAASCLAIGNALATLLNRFVGYMTYDTDPLYPSLTLYPSESQYPFDSTGTIDANNVIFSVASGPVVTRDANEQVWHGVVYWTPEYER